MKRYIRTLGCFLASSSCIVSGEAIAPGNESFFQVALISESMVAVSNTQEGELSSQPHGNDERGVVVESENIKNTAGEVVTNDPGGEARSHLVEITKPTVVVPVTQNNDSAPQPNVDDQKVFVGVEKVYRDFIKAHPKVKRGMVIGRGNAQGIANDRISISELKGLSWLFVDPGDAGAVGYLHDNEQDTSLGNALKATWPVDFSTEDAFDAVVFDYGTIQYIGDDGVYNHLGQEYFDKQMELVIMNADGTKTSKDSFDALYKFQDWLYKNTPPERQPLKNYYEPLMQAARQRQRKTLEKGLRDAYLALKQGGMLIIPIDGVVDGIDFASLLSISEADLVRHKIENIGSFRESPVLPQNKRGMGTFYSDYYSIIRK